MTQDSGRDPLGMFSCQDTFIKADSQVNSKYPLICPCWTLSRVQCRVLSTWVSGWRLWLWKTVSFTQKGYKKVKHRDILKITF